MCRWAAFGQMSPQRPKAQNLWRHIDSDFFYRRRGWGKASHTEAHSSHSPPRQSAILATHRARGEQGVLFGWSRHTRSWDHARQTNRPSHTHEYSVSTNTPMSGRAIKSRPARSKRARGTWQARAQRLFFTHIHRDSHAEHRTQNVAESDRKGESGGVRLLPENMLISCALRRRIFWCNSFSDPIFFRRALV